MKQANQSGRARLAVLDRPGRHVHRHHRRAPGGRLMSKVASSEERAARRDPGVARHSRHRPGAKAARIGDRRDPHRHDRRDQCPPRTTGRTDRARRDGRFRRRARDRLPEPAAPVRPSHRAARAALRRGHRGRRAPHGRGRGAEAPRRGAPRGGSLAPARARHRERRDRLHAWLPPSGARAAGGRARARTRLHGSDRLARGLAADPVREPRRHHGRRCLPDAAARPLRARLPAPRANATPATRLEFMQSNGGLVAPAASAPATPCCPARPAASSAAIADSQRAAG